MEQLQGCTVAKWWTEIHFSFLRVIHIFLTKWISLNDIQVEISYCWMSVTDIRLICPPCKDDIRFLVGITSQTNSAGTHFTLRFFWGMGWCLKNDSQPQSLNLATSLPHIHFEILGILKEINLWLCSVGLWNFYLFLFYIIHHLIWNCDSKFQIWTVKFSQKKKRRVNIFWPCLTIARIRKIDEEE